MTLRITPLTAIAEIEAGQNLIMTLAGALSAAGVVAEPFDILVVTQKIVSKAEGRVVALTDVTPGVEAIRVAALTRKDPRLVELVLAESIEIIRAVPHVLITRHRTGHVMANAGIDQSNLGTISGDQALLLPVDADRSAASLHAGLRPIWPAPFGIVISDSFGRPWRNGVTNVAIGACGLPALIDRRGTLDRNGRMLEVTQIALGDMAASAAGLVMGEGAEGVPAALIRGLSWNAPACPAAALVRPMAEDLFR